MRHNVAFSLLAFLLLICGSQSAKANNARFGLSESGLIYSDMVGMYSRRAGRISGSIHAWASSGTTANIYFSTSNQYFETFDRSGDFMILNGWGNQEIDVKGVAHQAYYQIYTTKVILIANGVRYDITSEYYGRGHPYALERIPSENYQLYVEVALVQYVDWVRTGAQMTYTWYVDWSKPAVRPTVNFGNRLSVVASELWTDSRGGNTRGVQSICEGIGYACWRLPYGASQPDGVDAFWNY